MRKHELASRLISFLRKRYRRELEHPWHDDPFKVLVSCVLSQRTREENTEAASRALFTVAATPHELARLPLRKLEKLIRPAGFPKQKARRLQAISKILLEQYGGRVPRNFDELTRLPGVGSKTANVVLCYGFGIPAIPVDTHVNRISRRLGLVSPNAKIEEVAPALSKIFPRRYWHVLNRGLVLFGREICRPLRPKCSLSPLSDLCPTGKQKLKPKKTK